METLKTIDNPNFSIIAPGPCNQSCDFCFWKRDKDECTQVLYLQHLASCLKRLPPQFRQVSITGGEPTYSGSLRGILEEIQLANRFDKVVFTTNATNLSRWLEDDTFKNVVTNINISRHALSEHHNRVMFQPRGKGETLPTLSRIFSMIRYANLAGIPVCCNTVINRYHEFTGPFGFIREMRDVGFSEICFRKAHTETSDLKPTKTERLVSAFKIAQHSECPVCRSDLRIIEGMQTWWTASIAEPSDLMVDKMYEAVFHPDGKLYADWSKNIEIEL
jgi:molybdenum cofactor biosynthesis enzyme MoaA